MYAITKKLKITIFFTMYLSTGTSNYLLGLMLDGIIHRKLRKSSRQGSWKILRCTCRIWGSEL